MKKSISLVFVLIVSVAVCAGAFATDYYIEDYNVDVDVGNNAVHAVKETLQFDFQNPPQAEIRSRTKPRGDRKGLCRT